MAIGRSNISQQVMKPPPKKKNNKKIKNKTMLTFSDTKYQKKKARRP
jgi:hypothetical protein|tara:strand:- start:406 stop:546 length:141 start_codon:yes stop_codon:yes gene_type:complete